MSVGFGAPQNLRMLASHDGSRDLLTDPVALICNDAADQIELLTKRLAAWKEYERRKRMLVPKSQGSLVDGSYYERFADINHEMTKLHGEDWTHLQAEIWVHEPHDVARSPFAETQSEMMARHDQNANPPEPLLGKPRG